MGIRSALGLQPRLTEVQDGITAGIYTGMASDPSRMPFASPWSTSQLERWAFIDMFGDVIRDDRQAAMSIPALARGRNLICTSGGKLPLIELEGDAPAGDQPYWITHTGDGSSPQHRNVWTFDDLIFYGLGCWQRNDVGTDHETRQRLNQDDWEINTDRREILVNGTPAGPNEVILFTGFHEGILNFGRQNIQDTLTLYRNVRQRIKNPIPGMDLHQVSGQPLTKDKKDELLADWRAAREDESKGGVAYTSPGIEAKPLVGGDDSALMIGARNAAAVDAARLIGITASKVDASGVNSTLTYETTNGRNQEFVDFDLDLYLDPFLARLSMDDVCEPGRRITADQGDFTTLTPSPTGPALED